MHACSKHVTRSSLFGGIAVVLLGDFDQLPPAGGPSIPEVAMMTTRMEYVKGVPVHKRRKYDITTVIRQGVELFTKAKLIKLSTQHRSEDPEHTHLLERMSGGQSIGINDLRNYKTLSAEDREFEFATILTPGNRERHEFNNLQGKRWAEKHGTNVIRWQRKMKENSWKGRPRNPQNEVRARQESCFWELFIPFALAYLSYNVNTLKGLANGTPVRYHSISFQDEEATKNFERLLEEAQPGEIITLDHPPDMINVELFPDFPDDDEKTRKKNEKHRQAWKHGSITTDGTVVVPIDVSSGTHLQWKTTQVRGGGGGTCRFKPSKVALKDWFPIEPGFSVTIHKAQASKHNFTRF